MPANDAMACRSVFKQKGMKAAAKIKNVEAPGLMGANTTPRVSMPATCKRGRVRSSQNNPKYRNRNITVASPVKSHVFQLAWFRTGSMKKKPR